MNDKGWTRRNHGASPAFRKAQEKRDAEWQARKETLAPSHEPESEKATRRPVSHNQRLAEERQDQRASLARALESAGRPLQPGADVNAVGKDVVLQIIGARIRENLRVEAKDRARESKKAHRRKLRREKRRWARRGGDLTPPTADDTKRRRGL